MSELRAGGEVSKIIPVKVVKSTRDLIEIKFSIKLLQ